MIRLCAFLIVILISFNCTSKYNNGKSSENEDYHKDSIYYQKAVDSLAALIDTIKDDFSTSLLIVDPEISIGRDSDKVETSFYIKENGSPDSIRFFLYNYSGDYANPEIATLKIDDSLYNVRPYHHSIKDGYEFAVLSKQFNDPAFLALQGARSVKVRMMGTSVYDYTFSEKEIRSMQKMISFQDAANRLYKVKIILSHIKSN